MNTSTLAMASLHCNAIPAFVYPRGLCNDPRAIRAFEKVRDNITSFR